ncbi:hypothetical protein [Catenovulum agarivorans]|uniref:hypothetical protein n=1 Tax=Catenovulum agarivorans TaxID=1172192 RepID=UPI00031E534A|nr:hypothetical protein [Catenovulum agarivorans]
MTENNEYSVIVNTPEEVAYKLMNRLLPNTGMSKPSEEQTLKMYSKCLRVVRGELPESVLEE